MEIKTKFNIGQKVWIVYENRKEVSVFSEKIAEVGIDNDGVYYFMAEPCIDEREENLIPYEDTENLVNKIKEIEAEIRERESK